MRRIIASFPISSLPAALALLLLLGTGPIPDAAAREIVVERSGTVITRSTSIKPGTWRVTDRGDGEGESGVLIIKGDGIVLDFNGAELVGNGHGESPDSFAGIGVISIGNSRLTIRNAVIRGFKTAIVVEGGDGVIVENCNLSGNYAQRLGSTPEREDGSDWLRPHDNDKDEWRRNYGGGLYLKNCRNAVVRGNRGHGSQNGILLSHVIDSEVHDNDFSFNSGWGLAMWRSCGNRITHNRFDWCVRGYSHGVYWRGQDSAGILVFEQNSDNFFGWNSATHGGDGFFLYAGNETLRRTGEGGCNRNVLFRNDFSHAVANGIEATFSDSNMFIENILNDCQHGIWGGYSYNTWVVGNEIEDCSGAGIAWEHGHHNLFEGNRFARNPVALDLWWDLDRDLMETPYGEKVSTDSCNNEVKRNRFDSDRIAVRLRETRKTLIEGNAFFDCGSAVKQDEKCRGTVQRSNGLNQAAAGFDLAKRSRTYTPPETAGSLDAFLPEGARRGRRFILVDEWGPYDFKKPKVWPASIAAGRKGTMFIYGPEGVFRIAGLSQGVTVSPMEGTIPGRLTIEAAEPGLTRFSFDVQAGVETVAASGTLLRADWKVKFFQWDKENDPRTDPESWRKLLQGEPRRALTLDAIAFNWGGGAPGENVRPDYFGTVAEADLILPGGRFEATTLSDDGIRVWIDEKLLIDNWTWHPPTEDRAAVTLKKGAHRVRIEHFEIDGWSALSFSLRPIKEDR